MRREPIKKVFINILCILFFAFTLFSSLILNAQGTQILNPVIHPPIFSPNDDGRKDTTIISFTSSKCWSAWTITICIPTNTEILREFSGIIEDGSKDVSIEWDGKDKDGNLLSDLTYKYRIYLETDVIPPTTEITVANPIYIHNDTNFSSLNTGYALNAVDHGTPVSGVDAVYYKINNPTNWNTYTNTIYLPADGLYTIDYKAKDIAGNQEREKHYTVYADGIPPGVPQGLTYYIHGSDIYLKWNVNTEWDFAGYNIYRNGNKLNIDLFTDTFYSNLDLADGEYSYSISSVDVFGNESNPCDPATVVFDGCLEIASPGEGSTNKNLTLIWADIICKNEFKQMKIEYGEGKFPELWYKLKEIEIKGGRFRVAYPWLTKDMNGEYTIRARGTKNDDTLREDSVTVFIYNPTAKEVVSVSSNDKGVDNDEPGNTPLVIVTTGKVNLDNTPPQIDISGIENGNYYDHSVCADIQITDEYLSQYHIILKKDAEVEAVEEGSKNTNYKICVKEDAKYEILVEAKDKSENVANASISFGIDTKDPGEQDLETDEPGDILADNTQTNTNTYEGYLGDGLDGIEEIEEILDDIMSSSNNTKGKGKKDKKEKHKTKKKSGKPGWVSINAKGKSFLSLYTNSKKKFVINLAPYKNKGRTVEIRYFDEEGVEHVLVLTNLSVAKKGQKDKLKNWVESAINRYKNKNKKAKADGESSEGKSDEDKIGKKPDKAIKKSTNIKDLIEKAKQQKKDKEEKEKKEKEDKSKGKK